ncbi:hypothetical protein ACE6H2_018662 [Prunus campanulata]
MKGGVRAGLAVKAIVVVIFTSMWFRCVSTFAAAATINTNHSVGGASGWDLSSNLQAWATHATFHVGDSLVFRYTPVHDVLEVKKTDYDRCHTVDPMETHDDGETVIQLREVGNRYFICGRLGHCAMGLKLHVQVFPAQLMTNNATSPTAPPPTTSDHHHDHPNDNNNSSHGMMQPSPPPADSNYSNNNDAVAAKTSSTSTTAAGTAAAAFLVVVFFTMHAVAEHSAS